MQALAPRPSWNRARLGFERSLLPAPCHAGADALWRAWRAMPRGPSGLPTRRDLDPAALRPLLPFLALVEPTPRGWQFRLTGTAFYERYRFEPTRRSMRDLLTAEAAAEAESCCNEAVAGAGPVSYLARVLGGGRDHVVHEGLCLPIESPKGDACWILGGIFFFDDPLRH